MTETPAPAPIVLDVMHRGPVTGCLHYGTPAECKITACATPPAVADYFGRYAEIADVVRPPFTVIALFTPGRGWFNLPLDAQATVTGAWARGAHAAGAVAARVGSNGIYADFQLTELV